ncbi:phosphatidylinositol N-acetylglucosaminyltransferase subunit C-like [Dendronephthya gigantea]|uniref:phosphatidylinositol N-acetylglucosaminyltransferase subunit C-like n=1 Tax=Dendronephthya gigantea TaxID=151771 RepID=UPI00106ACA9F|nr:phosphatidylinositol N-acetylglucosaminyltransferase subunit C-like [Dendronephthya gigantea]XP_028394610.1 phosphatidylinositol N-acetylglucosaminyltransferase subunit C-like [Dendronephthya gigantea]XP_028394611.1 phosphatidylinositol N-acetylglucosaminyltransferase subunit C-like [Dendronephthya gigantea]
MTKQQWKKILYEEQDYPDNYVDESFLDELRKNVYTRTYHFWNVSNAAGTVSQQVSSLCVFVMIFVYMKEELVSPSILFLASAVVTLISYFIYIMTCWEQKTKNVKDDVKSLILFLSFSFGLSPILRTLTDSISTDTIYAMTVFMLGMNLLMHDYGASGAIVSKAVSLNTAIFGSVCLASRLPSSWHAFVTVITAVEIFALFPLFREQMKVFSPGSQPVMTWGLLILAFVNLW